MATGESRTLYDAYAHCERDEERDDEVEDERERSHVSSSSYTLSTTSEFGTSTNGSIDQHVYVIISSDNGSCVTYAEKDDFGIARGRAEARDNASEPGDEVEGTLTRWSGDGRLYACARGDGRVYVCTRIGEIVWRANRASGGRGVAGCALALARGRDASEASTSYDLLSVNLKGAPLLTRARITLDREQNARESAAEDSMSLAKKLKWADGAEWVERERTLVVVGLGRSSTGSLITTWKYDHTDDFTNLRCARVIDCGGDVVPRRSLFRSPRRARLAVRLMDGSLSVATTSVNGCLSTFIASNDGDEVIKRIESRSDVVSAAWWSQTSLAVATKDGTLTVKTFPDDINVLGDEPESFDSIHDLVSAPKFVDGVERGRLLLLERTGRGGWRLISINERTSLEMLNSRMDSEEWGVALTLARQHGLNTDIVYKTRWVRSRVTTEGITDWLSRISDRAWVAVQCLTACAETYEIQRHVLVYGLKESDAQAKKARQQKSDTGDEPEWSWWVKVRIALLAALDRADTVREITGGGFSAQLYSILLHSPIHEAALNAAYTNDMTTLGVIVKRHAFGVSGVVFDVLSALPETADVASYENLLPWSEHYVNRDGPAQVAGRRARDWAESTRFLQHILELNESRARDDAHAAGISLEVAQLLDDLVSREWLLTATEELCKLKSNGSFARPSAQEMETWAIQRSCEMDTFMGSLGSARDLLDSASRGLRTSTLRECAIVSSILESAVRVIFDLDSGRMCQMSLEEYFESDAFEKLSVMLSMVTSENMAQLLPGPVRDLLNHVRVSSEEGPEIVREMLQRWILGAMETGELKLVTHTVSWLSSSVENLEIAGGADAIAAVTIEALLSRAAVDDTLVSESAEMLNELPVTITEVPMAKKAIARLNACRTLQEAKVRVTLNEVMNAEQDETSALKLLQNFIDSVVANTATPRWAELWAHVHTLQSGAFHRSMTHEQALGEILRAQLRNKDWNHAKRHIPEGGTAGAVGALVGGLKELGGAVSAILPAVAAEGIICDVSDEFLARAEDVEDEAAKAAESCLLLMPTRDACRKKVEFFEALRYLAENHVNRAPRAVTRHVALELVLEAVSKSDDAYRVPDVLQGVVAKLGVYDENAQLSILLATGSRAFESGDIEMAQATALRLTKRRYSHAWKLCADVARAIPTESEHNIMKGTLLAFALVHAEQDVLAALLSDWQASQTHRMLEVFADSRHGSIVDDKVNYEDLLSNACGDSSVDTSVRPAIKLLAKRSTFGRALDLIFRSNDEKAKEAASAISYALGVHGSNVSDDVLSKVAQSSIAAAMASCDTDALGSENPPATMWSSMAVLLTMRDASKVANVIDEVANRIQDRSKLQMVLNVGACVHALRALRPSWDSISLKTPVSISALVELVGKIERPGPAIRSDVEFLKQYRSSLGSVVDSEWLREMIPEVDAGAFASGDVEYRKRSIMALAAGSSSSMSGVEALENALRLADVYDVDSYDVYSAHAAILASEDSLEVRRTAAILKEKLPTRPHESVEMLQRSIWKTLPTNGKCAIESASAYFDVLGACDATKAQTLHDTSVALQDLARACDGFDLHVFVNAKGDAPEGGLTAALAEIQRATSSHSDFPQSTVTNIIAALKKFPSEISTISAEDVFFAVARGVLSPPSGALRSSPDQRWSALEPVLTRLGEAHLMEIARVLSGVPSPNARKELQVFDGEISSRTRLKVLEDISRVIGAEKCPNIRTARDNLHLVIRITEEIPGLHPALLRLLDESLRSGCDVQDICKQWVENSATFGQISTLAAIVETARSDQKVDVLLAVSSALSDALLRIQDDPSQLSTIIRKTLGGGSPKDERLAAARSSAFTTLERSVGVATPVARAEILKILSELAGGSCASWPGWRSHHDTSKGVMRVLAMRTGALLAPFGLESPDEASLCDVKAMCAYFKRDLVSAKVPFTVLSEILILWEDPPKRTKSTLKPCWITLLTRGVREGDATMDIVAEQVFDASRHSRWLSDEDLSQLLAETKASDAARDGAVIAKLSFLLGRAFDEASTLAWDAEAVAFALHGNQISALCAASSDAFDMIVSAAFDHERGREVLIPHIIAALTRASMYEQAASLAVKLTSTHPILAADFETRLAILRKQLYARAQKREAPGANSTPRTAFERSICKLSSTLSSVSASASGALEMALS